MTLSDLRCDACGADVPAPPGQPGGGVRFSYHPGDVRLRDNSGLLCAPCWAGMADRIGAPSPPGRCSVCDSQVTRHGSLHLRCSDQAGAWQLCEPDAADFLNRLVTVDPKFDRENFRLPLRHLDETTERQPGPG